MKIDFPALTSIENTTVTQLCWCVRDNIKTHAPNHKISVSKDPLENVNDKKGVLVWLLAEKSWFGTTNVSSPTVLHNLPLSKMHCPIPHALSWLCNSISHFERVVVNGRKNGATWSLCHWTADLSATHWSSYLIISLLMLVSGQRSIRPAIVLQTYHGLGHQCYGVTLAYCPGVSPEINTRLWLNHWTLLCPFSQMSFLNDSRHLKSLNCLLGLC